MAKRARDTGGSVNLFPFLSILICIIGCLTLIIVVINLIAMSKGEGRTSEEVERAREYVLLEKEKEEKQRDQDKLRQLIENLIQQNKDIITARDKLVTLKKMLENQEDIDKSREELIAKFNLLQTTNKKLVADEKFLQEEIKKKEEEIAKRGTPPEPAALRVRPSGSSATTRPFFAEISDRGVYLHRSLTAEPTAIPRESSILFFMAKMTAAACSAALPTMGSRIVDTKATGMRRATAAPSTGAGRDARVGGEGSGAGSKSGWFR